MKPTLIINGTLIDQGGIRPGPLAIAREKIAEPPETGISSLSGYTVIDATGRYIFPGGIDPHVHLALPTPAGNSCDDFRSGSLAALAGGTTTLFDFVTPARGQSLPETLDWRRQEAAAALTECHLHMGISEWNAKVAGELTRCIRHHGIRSVKAYLAYRESIGVTPSQLREVMLTAAGEGALVMVHAEDGGMIADKQRQLILNGKTRPAFHAVSRPAEAEIRAIGEVIDLAAKTSCTTYIVHISTRRGAEMTGEAKRSGIAVYGETCPQYLIHDDSVYDPARPDHAVLPFVLSPPIRTAGDREGLWEALANRWIDVVATDHCPFHTRGQKERGLHDFTLIPNGAGGVEHRLTLLYTYGVTKGRITMERMVELVACSPAKIFGLGNRKGALLPGYDADVVLWDPDTESVISAQTHRSLCDHDLYESIRVKGKAAGVIRAGRLISDRSFSRDR